MALRSQERLFSYHFTFLLERTLFYFLYISYKFDLKYLDIKFKK